MSNRFIQVFSKFIIMMLLVTTYGCAAKKLLVKNADNLLEHQIEKRLPLYSAQKTALSKDIATFLNEHRKKAQEVFPIIDELAIEDSKKFEGQYHKLAKIYDKLSLSFTALLAKHMAQLDKKQQKEFFDTLADENRQLAKKDPEERMEKVEERFKTLFGAIDNKQKQMLTDLQDEFEANNASKPKRRIHLMEKLKEVYVVELSTDSKKAQILSHFTNYQDQAHNHDRNIVILKKISTTLSAEQREFFRKRVAEVKDILRIYVETDY